MTCPQLKWNLHCPSLPTIFAPIIAHSPLFWYGIPLSMPNLKAQVRATEAANSQMFAWQANHLAMCFNFRGRKKNSIKARHRRINRKKGKMSLMFPALFIQIHCTSTTECITFAKFSIQMTSWIIHIANASTGTPRAACFFLDFHNDMYVFPPTQIALPPNGNNRNNHGNPLILRFSGRKNRRDFFEIFLPPSPWDDGGKNSSRLSV